VNSDDRVLVTIPLVWAIGLDCQIALFDLGALSMPSIGPALADVHDFAPTVIVCTPTDILRMAYVAAGEHVDLAPGSLRLVVVTGEPGGSIGATRRTIEERCGARCLDVYALTELGAIGWGCSSRAGGIHLQDDALTTAAHEAESDRRVTDGELGELVVTTPVDRPNRLDDYHTGDLVRLSHGECECGRSRTFAEGGVLGRVTERLTVRGIDLLPTSIEEVVRRHPAVVDFRLRVYGHRGADSELEVQLEPADAIASEGDRARVAAEVSEDLKRSLGLRLQCELVAPGAFADDQDSGRRARRLSRQ
jgi:phenylacetate-CoA ligase